MFFTASFSSVGAHGLVETKRDLCVSLLPHLHCTKDTRTHTYILKRRHNSLSLELTQSCLFDAWGKPQCNIRAFVHCVADYQKWEQWEDHSSSCLNLSRKNTFFNEGCAQRSWESKISVVTTGLNAEPVISGMTWTKRWPAQVALTPVHATNKHQHQRVCVWGCLSVEIPMKGTSKASSCSQVYENITPDVMCVLSKSLSESITRSQSDTSDCPLCCSG